MTDDKTRQLENRIESLESTIEKMMPSRRDALKLGGAALVGGAAMSGTASAGTNQVGTIGSQASPVDLESEDINNADTVTTNTLDSTTQNNSGTVTTQDLVVNGTATGPFGGGGILLEAGDTIQFESFRTNGLTETFVTLFDGNAKDVLGGTISGNRHTSFKYTFGNGSTIETAPNDFDHGSEGEIDGKAFEVTILPPAKNVAKIEVKNQTVNAGDSFGAEVMLVD